MIDAATVLARSTELPTLPTVVAQLSALIADDRAEVASFERVITPDPTLTASLLRQANSPAFGQRRQIDSVRQAVMVLGTKRLFGMATGVSLAGVVPGEIPGYQCSSQSFWVHCIAVAVLSEKLAQEINLSHSRLLFTAGLLHDIGKLAIGTFLDAEVDQVAQLLRESEVAFATAERDALGTDHAEVGELLAEQWGLPQAVGWAARWHHDPNNTPKEVDRDLVGLIHLADGLAHSLGYGVDLGELSREVKGDVIDRLGIKTQQLERVASLSMLEIREMGQALADSQGGDR